MNGKHNVEVYLGPQARKDIAGAERHIKEQLHSIRLERVPVVCGSTCSDYDYCAEGLSPVEARDLSHQVSLLEGFATKIVDWQG